jgi:hypothetical protein
MLEFGEQREINLMGWVDSVCDGTYLTVVSLLRNDDVEVRVMRSEKNATDGTEEGPFGLFQLRRFEEACDFE